MTPDRAHIYWPKIPDTALCGAQRWSFWAVQDDFEPCEECNTMASVILVSGRRHTYPVIRRYKK